MLAVLNGFGRTLGDGIIGLQALHAAREVGVVPDRAVLFRLPGLPLPIQELYLAAGDFCVIRELPWADATPVRGFAGAAGFARVVDIRDFAFDPGFRGVAMIDFFLAALGVDPGAVPAAPKRNLWLAPRVPVRRSSDYVLVCPRTATPLRDMPQAVHARILDWLRSHTGIAVLSQAELPPAASLAELCGLVAGARLVVSADTAMVHLADAFAVPCLAFFTTHRPEWRVRDYSLCTSVHLPVPGLPAALEFSRGEADEAAARAAWFPDGEEPAWLDAALASAWRTTA